MRYGIQLLAVIAVLFATPLRAASADQPEQVVRKLYDAFGSGDMNAIKSLLADNVVWVYHAPKKAVPFAGTYNGPEDVFRFFADDGKYVQVTSNDINEVLPSGDQVIVRGAEHGIAKATGRKFVADWVHIFKIKDGKIVHFDEYIDSATIVLGMKK